MSLGNLYFIPTLRTSWLDITEAVNSGDPLEALATEGPTAVERLLPEPRSLAGRLLAGGRLMSCRWARGTLSAVEPKDEDQLGLGEGESCDGRGELEKDTEHEGEDMM